MRIITLASLLLTFLLLQGCATIFIAGAAAGISLANDRRSPAAIVEDQKIENQARRIIKQDSELDHNAHISITSFNRVVLITGQVQNTPIRDRVTQLIKSKINLQRLHNELTIRPPVSMQIHTQDTWLTSKVKNALLRRPNLNVMHIKVVSENNTVYLMGLVSQAEGRAAAAAAQLVGNINRVITVFEYID